MHQSSNGLETGIKGKQYAVQKLINVGLLVCGALEDLYQPSFWQCVCFKKCNKMYCTLKKYLLHIFESVFICYVFAILFVQVKYLTFILVL